MSEWHETSEPQLSIVIPCHNRADLLRCCLISVKRHAPPRTEIIVVDDASPAGSASRVAESFDGVRTVRLTPRQGFCIAANRGIHEARAGIVQLLNDDTEVGPDWALPALRCFRDPSVVAVAPLVLQFGATEPRIDSAGDCYHWGGFAWKRGHGQALAGFPLAIEEVFGASGSSAFYRKDAFRRVGGFPESFGSYFEDVDLSFRLRRAGGRIVFCPLSCVFHHCGASHGIPNRSLLEQQSRNEELVFWRNMPAHLLPFAVPLHLAVLFGKAVRRWREGQIVPFLRGRWQAAIQVARIVQHRWHTHPGAVHDTSARVLERAIGPHLLATACYPKLPKSRNG